MLSEFKLAYNFKAMHWARIDHRSICFFQPPDSLEQVTVTWNKTDYLKVNYISSLEQVISNVCQRLMEQPSSHSDTRDAGLECILDATWIFHNLSSFSVVTIFTQFTVQYCNSSFCQIASVVFTLMSSAGLFNAIRLFIFLAFPSNRTMIYERIDLMEFHITRWRFGSARLPCF